MMNTPRLVLSVGLLVTPLTVGLAQRQVQELPAGWRFIRRDAGLQADASGWEAVSVPHSWNTYDSTKSPAAPDAESKKDAYFSPRKQPTTEVKAYTNCAEAKLKINGKSIGRIKPDEIKVARWADVPLQPGKNTVEVTGFADGKEVQDACEWVLEWPWPLTIPM